MKTKRQYRLEAEEMDGWDHIGTYPTFNAALKEAHAGEFISTWEAPEGSEDWDEVDRVEILTAVNPQ